MLELINYIEHYGL